MKRFILFLIVMAGFIMSCFPMILSGAYLFTGGDRQAFLDLLNKIPKENFWLFAVPMVIINFCCTAYLFWKVFEIGLGDNKPLPKKEVYYLEDDNLQEKLQGLISMRPGTYEGVNDN